MGVVPKTTPNIKVIDNTAFLVIDRALYNTKEGIRRGLLDVAPEIEREAIRLIKSPPKTGRLYRRGGKIHQASAPGEAPADLSGELAAGIDSSVSSPTVLIIGDRAEHGRWLEGNVANRTLPRPHLRPAALSKAREVEQAILLGVDRELKKGK